MVLFKYDESFVTGRGLERREPRYLQDIDRVHADQIIASNGTYHFEGVAFEAYATNDGASGMQTLERFYNTNTGLHFFAYRTEAGGINHGAAGPGWVDEGATFTVHLADGLLLT